MAQPKQTKSGGKGDGENPKGPAAEPKDQPQELSTAGHLARYTEQDLRDGVDDDHLSYGEPERDFDSDDPSRWEEDQIPENELPNERDADGTFQGEVSAPAATATDEDDSPEVAVPVGPETSSDENTRHQPDEAELTEFVDLIAKAERAGDNDRLAVGSRIFSRFFGNDISLMTSRNPRKVASFALLASKLRDPGEESTLRGWVYGAYVHDDLRNANVSVDPPLSLTVYSLLFRLKDARVWREIAPQVAGKPVSKAKEYIKARTGKQKTESTSDMILRQLKNPLRAMHDGELVSLITDPDLLAARLDEGQMHKILGEFVNIRKPVEDFLATVTNFQRILIELNRSYAA
jgi:hypothetical protein